MKRRFGSRNTVSVSTATLALVAAFAACVTDSAGTVYCEQTNLWCPPRTVCAMDGNRCDPEGCGDGIVDRLNGEVCDYENPEHGDLCSEDCRVLESCGNGKLDPGELCDATAPDSMGRCGTDCRPLAACGDGEVNVGEDCDQGSDGIPRSTPTCNADCSVPWCGDGTKNTSFVNPATGRPEECDTVASTATCDADCTLPECGDALFNASFVNPATSLPEQCDEGGDAPSCDSDCTLPECGDLLLNNAAGEDCDEGKNAMLDPPAPVDSTTCDVDCTLRVCGDGHANKATDGIVAPEACDDGLDSTTCNGPGASTGVACQPARCGDEYVNQAAGEACDDGMGEEDDDDPTSDACPSGPLQPGDARIPCQPARCGDGFTHDQDGGTEVCDDGGDSSTCNGSEAGTVACRVSTCGDGYRNQVDGEFCDDGNVFDFDDCPSGSPPKGDQRARCRPARCGDGFHRFGLDLCDPGSGQNADGPPIDADDCDSDCTFVACGDRHVNAAVPEECDEGGETATCNGSNAGDDACKRSICGDGYVNEAAGEECESDERCGTGGGCRLGPEDPMRCHCL